MQGKTFEVGELSYSAAPEPVSDNKIDRRIGKMLRLGFTRQASLLCEQRENCGPETIVTGHVLSDDEAAIWDAHLPWCCDIEDYDSGEIPEEVLDAIGRAQSSGAFDDFQIWQSDREFMVLGFIGDDDAFLIARWALEGSLSDFDAICRECASNAKRLLSLLSDKRRVWSPLWWSFGVQTLIISIVALFFWYSESMNVAGVFFLIAESMVIILELFVCWPLRKVAVDAEAKKRERLTRIIDACGKCGSGRILTFPSGKLEGEKTRLV